MRKLVLLIANTLSALLPQTRYFGTRRCLYRAAGVDVSDGVKINGLVRMHHPNVSIGADTWVGAGSQIIASPGAGVTIGARCDIGPEVMFVVGDHQIGPHYRRAGAPRSGAISIGSGTWIGARATFLADSTVGSGCVIGAGALVNGKFPPDVLIVGIPARVLRQLDPGNPHEDHSK